MSKKPSDIATIFPSCSTCGDTRLEDMAQRIAHLLANTGDVWRIPTFEEFKARHLLFGVTDIYIEDKFRLMRGVCHSPEIAAMFSCNWKRVLKSETKGVGDE